MANGRLGNWQAPGLPGGRDVTDVVSDLFSMPSFEDSVTLWMQDAMDFAMAGAGDVNGHSVVGDPHDNFVIAGHGQSDSFVRENFHPVLGYQPGFFHVQGANHAVGAGNPTPNYEFLSRVNSQATVPVETSSPLGAVTGQVVVGPANLSSIDPTTHAMPWGQSAAVATGAITGERYLMHSRANAILGTLTNFTDVPTHAGYHWDPGYSTIVGNSWHRLCGLSTMKSAWLHPYVSGPVSVFASYVPLYDLHGTMDWTDRSGRVTGFGQAAQGDEVDLTELGITQVGQLAQHGGGSFETGYAHAVSVSPMNAPEFIKSKMNGQVAVTPGTLLFDGDYTVGGSLFGATFLDATNPILNFNLYSMAHSMPNSMCRNPVLKFGAYGIDKLNASGVAACTPPLSTFAGPGFLQTTDYGEWNGENLIPYSQDATATGPASSRGTSPVCAYIAHDINGLCGEFEDYETMTSPIEWYHDMMSGIDPVKGPHSMGSFQPGYLRLAASTVRRELARSITIAPTTNVPPSIAMLDLIGGHVAAYLPTLAGGLGTEITPNPWFSRRIGVNGTSMALSYRSLERRRKEVLANPWIGGDNSVGRTTEGKYEASDIQPSIDAFRESFRQEGVAMMTGLSKEVFLTLQLAN